MSLNSLEGCFALQVCGQQVAWHINMMSTPLLYLGSCVVVSSPVAMLQVSLPNAGQTGPALRIIFGGLRRHERDLLTEDTACVHTFLATAWTTSRVLIFILDLL